MISQELCDGVQPRMAALPRVDEANARHRIPDDGRSGTEQRQSQNGFSSPHIRKARDDRVGDSRAEHVMQQLAARCCGAGRTLHELGMGANIIRRCWRKFSIMRQTVRFITVGTASESRAVTNGLRCRATSLGDFSFLVPSDDQHQRFAYKVKCALKMRKGEADSDARGKHIGALGHKDCVVQDLCTASIGSKRPHDVSPTKVSCSDTDSPYTPASSFKGSSASHTPSSASSQRSHSPVSTATATRAIATHALVARARTTNHLSSLHLSTTDSDTTLAGAHTLTDSPTQPLAHTGVYATFNPSQRSCHQPNCVTNATTYPNKHSASNSASNSASCSAAHSSAHIATHAPSLPRTPVKSSGAPQGSRHQHPQSFEHQASPASTTSNSSSLVTPSPHRPNTVPPASITLPTPRSERHLAPYLPAGEFVGKILGYAFKIGPSGLGYYLDMPEVATAGSPALAANQPESVASAATSVAPLLRTRSTPRTLPALNISIGALRNSANTDPRHITRSASCGNEDSLRAANSALRHTQHSIRRTDTSLVYSKDGEGPITNLHARLARKQHWRRCPRCDRPVEHRGEDGSGRCPTCLAHFRWTSAELVLPADSLSQLLTEFRWQDAEARQARLNNQRSPLSIPRRLWGQQTPDCTPNAKLKLLLWRAAISPPLAMSIPALLVASAALKVSHARAEPPPLLPPPENLHFTQPSSMRGQISSIDGDGGIKPISRSTTPIAGLGSLLSSKAARSKTQPTSLSVAGRGTIPEQEPEPSIIALPTTTFMRMPHGLPPTKGSPAGSFRGSDRDDMSSDGGDSEFSLGADWRSAYRNFADLTHARAPNAELTAAHLEALDRSRRPAVVAWCEQ